MFKRSHATHAYRIRYLVQHKGPNRARRRELEAKARQQGDTPHELGSLPAPPKERVAQAHEARRFFSRNGAPRLFLGFMPSTRGGWYERRGKDGRQD